MLARPASAALVVACLLSCLVGGAVSARAAGARLFKSGPVQITADGAWVWVALDANASVARLETATDRVEEYPLPGPGPHGPKGLSVTEDGSEVWVACHDGDHLHVLDGTDGSELARIDLPWGSGPHSVALSRDQSRALVTLHRASALAVVDVATRTATARLAPVYRSPLGICWLDDGVTAWVTHLFADGEDPFLTRVDFSGPEPRVVTSLIVKSTTPKQSSRLAAPTNLAEGGYLTFRGHLAQVPSAAGGARAWIPTQYNNINEDTYTPDTTIQSTIRTLDTAGHLIPNTNTDKVILTAVHVHDPVTSGNPYVGPGWDAHVSGPVDLGFSTDGATGYVLFEQSGDVLVMPTTTPASKPSPSTPPLPEIEVGNRPLGMAVSPRGDTAWVWNSLDWTVSVVDLAGLVELRTVPVSPVTGVPAPYDDPAVLEGARIFHGSDDPRISVNQKVACASCHPHGEHDGRTWNFENLPGAHGPRSTMSLLGLADTYGPPDPTTGWGQLHRSGDRDEVQDFEHAFQGVNMGGTGFLGGAVQPELGPPNAGLSPELDSLAAYVLSLPPVARSPFRRADGSLTEAAVRGATFFVGADPARAADADCASCHVPETGFVDRAFHDVGQRRAAAENELNARTPSWNVNTPTLVGVWATPPYDGVFRFASSLLAALVDFRDPARPASHGRVAGLTGRQLRDLAELVASLDGNTTAAELRGARDTTPPRVVRVEPAGLTRIDVWLSESVDPSAASASAWRVRQVGGPDVSVTAATWDPVEGDRITLTVDALSRSCAELTYEVAPLGPILDMADRATGGAANALDVADPANTFSFPLADTLTITLGASHDANVSIPVRDAATIGTSNSTWSHGSPWLYAAGNTGPANTGFVAFDFEPALRALGVTSSAEIVDARFTLEPEWGDLQSVQVRRVLQPWGDPGGGDWNSNPTGGPTWRDSQHPSVRWNQANAGAATAGVDGRSPSDYGGTNDLGFTPDVVATMTTINEPFEIAGPGVTDAYRFWFDNPALNDGHALRVVYSPSPVRYTEAKLGPHEADLGDGSPTLSITYALPGPVVTPPPPEVSPRGAAVPLTVARDPSGLRLDFEDLGAAATAYNVYEGALGAWYSHAGAACGQVPAAVGAARELVHAPAAGDRYFLVTASDACQEGAAGTDSFGTPRPAANLDCAP